ncbi:TIGR02266 family protein [Hyalangium sp.]|uniref:TIGR02266 family protein n=1 Tax=Hyalangium sp. TaxID=2028555 RepID=UPI002D694034|nr:TIGR02266 family protein [Hyalangium sp.]HYH99983.1 TIGR02266 family protein [Hyalangium sp.]
MTDSNQGPIGLAVKLPFATPEEFLAKYGANVTRGGIYLRSKMVKPPGTLVTLDLKLSTGERIIYASAIVHFVTGQQGQGIPGMGLRFLTLDPETKRFLDSALASLPHAQSAEPPVPPGVGAADYIVPPPPSPVQPAPAPEASPAQDAGASPAAEPAAPVAPAVPGPGTSPAPATPAPIPQPAAAAPATPASVPQPVRAPAATPAPAPPVAATPAPVPPVAATPPAPSPELAPASVPQAPVPQPGQAPTRPSGTYPAAPGQAPTRPSGTYPVAPGQAPTRPSGTQLPVVSAGASAVLNAPPFEPPKEEPKREGPIIGIDLGTTNSCAASVRSGKPEVLRSREGHNTVPSILALNTRGKMVVGHPAKGQMLTNPRQTVYGAKRLVGRSYESPIVQHIKDRFHYEVAPGDSGEAAVKLGNRVFSLQQISALILREVREVAQNQLGHSVSRAVITVPAYYNDNQRQAVREAGQLAGLYVERILNEPTAAALAYGYGRKLNQRILVYDLGGGTFDASVLELYDTVYEVISTGGDTFLGGIDFDNAIVEYLLEEFQKQTGKVFQGDRVAMQRIHDAAERAKCALSERTDMRIHVAFVTMIDNTPYDLDVTLTRKKLIELTEKLVDRTIEVCGEVLEAKGLTPKDIQEVVLVGGQSRFPLVHEKITKYFGKPPTKNVHPDEAVALGAALFAHSLGQKEGVTLIDVLPMAIGVGLPGGRFKAVMERNAALPTTKAYTLSTSRDNQAELEVSIFQGESNRVAENEFLGTLKLAGLPLRPRGEVQVSITFEVSNESLLKVTAKENSTGREVSSTFTTRDTPEAVKARLEQENPEPPPTGSSAAAAKGAPGAIPGGAMSPPPPTKKVGMVGWLKGLFGRR